MNGEFYKRIVDGREELLSRILDAAARIKETWRLTQTNKTRPSQTSLTLSVPS
jgi:hypothetical protein